MSRFLRCSLQRSVFASSGHGTVTIRRNPVPIRGIQRERLGPVAFYAAVGRADLAAEYRSSRRKKRVVGGVSIGALVTSSVLFGVGMSELIDAGSIDLDCSLSSPSYDACSAEEDRQVDRATGMAGKWFIGAGVGFVGFIAFAAIYGFMDPHPVSEAERRLLAHDHNARLRRELRLPRLRPHLSVTPFVSGEGGGFMATGRF